MSLFKVNPPDCIRFDVFGPSKTETLKITNTAGYPIAFKVRITASKSYLVKPNQGYLKVDESVVISITLQGSETQPEIKHKLMVLATHASNVEDFNLWNSVEKDKIFDVKLDIMMGNRASMVDGSRKSAIFSDSKSSPADNMSVEELTTGIKKLEAEKNLIEGRISQINMELRTKEMRQKKGEDVRFKRNSLIVYALGGFLLGYMYS